MLLEELELPIRLIHPNLKIVEEVDNIDYLKYQTKLGVKKQALLNCILCDNNLKFLKIIEIIDKGDKGPWWEFEFFNSMRKVDLTFVKIDENQKSKITKVLT